MTTALSTLIFNVSSGSSNESANSGGESGGSRLPTSESSSSSESLATFRNVIAAENETEIYQRIKNLENGHYYSIPPQTRPGEYEAIVRHHFDQAINVNNFREILDQESFELQVLERKGLLQDRLQNLMLAERNIERIMELSPYTDVRKEAYHFLQDKVEPVGDLRHAFQRHIMDGSLNSFQDFRRFPLSFLSTRHASKEDSLLAILAKSSFAFQRGLKKSFLPFPNLKTSCPEGQYRIGSHSCLNSKANQSYERALPRVGRISSQKAKSAFYA